MYAIIKLYTDMVSFKTGPQDIPSSSTLLRLLMVIYLIINYFILLLSSDWLTAFFQVSLELLMLLGFVKGLTSFAKKTERYTQTACALLGTDALISLLAFPVIATLLNHASLGSLVTVILLMLWHWLVIGHILRHTLSKPFFFGLGVAFLYLMISYQIMAVLFPELTPHQPG